MLLAGDELGRTQQGNNNTYCQDNEINWLNWNDKSEFSEELTPFVASLTQLKVRFPMLSYRRFIHKDDKDSQVDITWFHPSGQPMHKEHWHAHHAATLGYMIHEKLSGSPVLLCLYHAGKEPIEFQLPEVEDVGHWQVVVDTNASAIQEEQRHIPAERKITMVPFSTIVLLND